MLTPTQETDCANLMSLDNQSPVCGIRAFCVFLSINLHGQYRYRRFVTPRNADWTPTLLLETQPLACSQAKKARSFGCFVPALVRNGHRKDPDVLSRPLPAKLAILPCQRSEGLPSETPNPARGWPWLAVHFLSYLSVP